MFEIRIVAALMEQYSIEDWALWTSGVLATLFLHLAAGYMGVYFAKTHQAVH